MPPKLGKAYARPDKDKITISFNRFQCLRSIACAVVKRDRERLDVLTKELSAIEAREVIELYGVSSA